jgi:2-methylcitrate dehydratase
MSASVMPALAQRAAAQDTSTSKSPKPEAASLAERLATYAAGLRYGELGAATVERVKSHLVDTLGCGIAALDENPVRICRELAVAAGGQTASVIGSGNRATPDMASFANGAAFRYYDLNGVYVGRANCHPSDNIAACLAVAEAEGSSPTELIAAIALAYEINCRLADPFYLGERGWDDATVFSLPAAALAAGVLMKLPAQRLAQAVNLSLNNHIPLGQTRAQTLSDWKGLADADAARNGVFAAMLARAGLTGPAPIFEGRRGFFQLVSGPAEIDVDSFGGRGGPFKINECGMKAYPVVVYAQTAVVASLAIAREVGDLNRISRLEVVTTVQGYVSAGRDPEKWTPQNRDTADHSLPYIVARAMFDGDITNASYAPQKLRDSQILAFMRKITVVQDPTMETARGAAPPIRINADLAGGGRVTREVSAMPGFAGQAMSREDVERKFRSNVGKRWPNERIETTLRALWTLDMAADMRGLLANLRSA